ncbi:WcbI family polysaccharide biosynthesis putative acetyltransferase [Bosea thiooxidans]
MTKVCILGNCQAQHLETMLKLSRPDVEVLNLEPVFMMTAEHHAAVYDRLGAADLIFAQRISNEFKLDWLSSEHVRATFGSKVTVWPNVYFDGYFPGVNYIYHGSWGKLLSPLLEYHFQPLTAAFKAGLSVEQAIDRFAGEGLLAATPDPFEVSLAQLRGREADVDVAISDHLAERIGRERCFYTPNHPTNELLGELLARLLGHVGEAIDVTKGVAMPYRLDEVYIAASPAVAGRYDLPFDREPRYVGREILGVEGSSVKLGGAKTYDLIGLTEAFYRLYENVFVNA